MMEKLKILLGSIRFWEVTIAAIAAGVMLFVPNDAIDKLAKIIIVWMGTVATIGTVDSVSTKFGTGEKTK